MWCGCGSDVIIIQDQTIDKINEGFEVQRGSFSVP